MGYQDVLAYQERLVKNYKYRPLPTLQRDEAREFYTANLPEGFCLDGARVPVFAGDGLKIADGYNRVVIGDYGAFVELLPEQVVRENVRVKPGEEYRDENPRYSGKVAFSWLTTTDESDVKIQFQKKAVGHTDMVPGRYYVSVFECEPARVQEKGQGQVASVAVSKDMIDGWLKEYGVYTEDLAEYYYQMVLGYGSAVDFAIEHNVAPYELEFWFCVQDVCWDVQDLTYEQYTTVAYNLQVIHCSSYELKGKLEALSPEVRTAIELGLEGLAIPYEFQNLPMEMIRTLLSTPADDLLNISKFAKVIAGHKAENMEHSRDVNAIIADANQRVSQAKSQYKEYEHVLG